MLELRIVLIGKTGNGKSSTGNTILRKDVFEEEFKFSSVTKLPEIKHAQFGEWLLEVIDSPGLMDADLHESQHREVAFENMEIIMKKVKEIGVFILVLNYIASFSAEEFQAISMLEDIFGGDFLKKHGMVVITHGDNFEADQSASGGRIEDSFNVWCKTRNLKFQQLLEKVNKRVILVYNKGEFTEGSNKMKSSEKILEMAKQIVNKNGTYNRKDFDNVQRQRRAAQSQGGCILL